jgi:acetamidase/formamidase
MKVLPREKAFCYEVDPNIEPIIKVVPGEIFKVETNDNFGNEIVNRGAGSFNSKEIPLLNNVPFKANPLGGPIYVEGAEWGDVIAVKIHDIIPSPLGWTGTMEGNGVLYGRLNWDECQGNQAFIVKNMPGPSGTTSDGSAQIKINDHIWSWKLNPHIGTILTCMEKGRGIPNSLTAHGCTGGNIDSRDIRKGCTIFLNSFNEGGLLYLGDLHASQGDSELTSLAVECSGEVVLSIDLIKNKRIPGVLRVETPDSIIQIDSASNAGSHKDALNNCFINMMDWLVKDYGFSQLEAYVHMSANSEVRINTYQFVDTLYTCGVEFPKKFLI